MRKELVRRRRRRRRKRRVLAITLIMFCFIVTLGIFNSKFKKNLNEPNIQDEISEQENNSIIIEEQDDNVEQVVAEGYEAIEEFLDEESANKRFQGVALVAEGDEIKFAKAYGYADFDENRKNKLTTRFSIASNTKQFTATAIMQLVEVGKVKLDETIDKYFPMYEYGARITVENLLQMRSGIPCYLNEIDLFMKDPDTINMLKEYDGRKYYDAYVEDRRWTAEVILKNLYLTDLKFEPNEEYGYCNTNYYLLGLIIEKASGISYESYIEKNIFEPSGMKTSSMELEELDAKGHGSKESGEIAANSNFTFSAGNIHANVYDLLKWNRALHKGDILSTESYNEMITPVDKYGYGLFIKDGYISHSGVIDGFNSNTEYNPETDVTIIVLENLDQRTELLDAKYDTSIIRGLLP